MFVCSDKYLLNAKFKKFELWGWKDGLVVKNP